jgi:tetratricopeptide (TPR) repeat protein
MMIAVAAMAVALGVGIEVFRLKRFRDQFLAKAKEHEAWEATYSELQMDIAASSESRRALTLEMESDLAKLPQRRKPLVFGRNSAMEELEKKMTDRAKAEADAEKRWAAEERDRAAKFADYAAYHAALKQKYLRASERPWRSLEPDPPPPEPTARGDYWIAHGDYQQALAGYEQAVGDEPENSDSLNNLAWLLSTCPDAALRDGKRAVELATHACDLTERENPSFLDTLAAASAEAGDFKAAAETQREAIGLLSKGDRSAKDYRGRLELYEANRAFRVANEKAK